MESQQQTPLTMDIPQFAQRLSLGKQLFLTYPIFDRICTYLQPRELVRLRRTTKELSGFFESLFGSQWNINRPLTRFVSDPVAFRSGLFVHNAVISGSFALQFLDRVVWEESDLDIFDEFGPGAARIGEDSTKSENYEIQAPQPWDHLYGREPDIEEVRTCIRTPKDQKQRKIQLIVSRRHKSPLSVIFGFYTTAVINILTWNMAYSIFPDATFCHKTYSLQNMTYLAPLFEKYSGRGFTPFKLVWPEDERSTPSLPPNIRDESAGLARHIGDSLSWTVALDTANITPGLSSSLMALNSFDVHRGSTCYSIVTSPFLATVLRYQYMITPSQRDFWYGFVGPRTQELATIRLLKMPEGSRPITQWGEPMNPFSWHHWKEAATLRGNPPEGWEFRDEEIPCWQEIFVKSPQAMVDYKGRRGN